MSQKEDILKINWDLRELWKVVKAKPLKTVVLKKTKLKNETELTTNVTTTYNLF